MEPTPEPGTAAGPHSQPPPQPRPAGGLVFDDPLDGRAPDDTDRGWGGEPEQPDDAAGLARFLRERPPHHL